MRPLKLPRRGAAGVARFVGTVRRAFRLVWTTDRRTFLTIIVLEVLNGVALGAELVVGRALLDSIGPTTANRVHGSISDIVPELLALGVLAMFMAVSSTISETRSSILGEKVSRRVQREVLDVTTTVSVRAFDDPEFHDHVRRSVESSTSQPWQLVAGLMGMVGALAGLVSVTLVVFALQPWIAILAVVSYLPVWVVSRKNSREQFAAQVELTSVERERWYLVELMTGRLSAGELRSLDANEHFLSRYERVNDTVIDRLKAVARAKLRRTTAASGGSVVIVLVAMLAAIAMAYNHDLSVANAIIVVLGVQQLGNRLRVLGGSVGNVYACTLFLDDLQAFLDLAPTLQREAFADSALRGKARDAVSGGIRLDHVSFRYPGSAALALDDVSVEVAPGELVALVGENGSGKTTLARLVAGLYDPDVGVVWWNDLDVASLPEGARRGQIALVFQDFLRLHYSAGENIEVGDWRRNDAELLRRVALEAGARGFIDELPYGFATRLGREFDNGSELSTGQWQRLVLARTLYSSCPFVILDEPTAALDPRAEARFFADLRASLRGRTAIVISHRMISARVADRVYVLHHGRVVEEGAHEQLVCARGLYSQMVRAQATDRLRGSAAAPLLRDGDRRTAD